MEGVLLISCSGGDVGEMHLAVFCLFIFVCFCECGIDTALAESELAQTKPCWPFFQFQGVSHNLEVLVIWKKSLQWCVYNPSLDTAARL